jgi:hypothetical protein
MIRVVFAGAASGQPFSVSEVAVDELPDVFDTESEIAIADTRYEIVEAQPAFKKDFAATGAVTLTLRRLELADPDKILFSLPSIDTTTPGPGDTECPPRKCLSIHEDDWRQIEFISMAHLPGIRSELSAVERVYRECRQGAGFRRIHVREEIGAPLFDTLLDLRKAKKELGSARTLKGFSVGGNRRLAADSFAFETDLGMTFFGLATNNTATALCCSVHTPPRDPDKAAERIAAFTARHRLVYVDWCWMVALNEDEAEFRGYFEELVKR